MATSQHALLNIRYSWLIPDLTCRGRQPHRHRPPLHHHDSTGCSQPSSHPGSMEERGKLTHCGQFICYMMSKILVSIGSGMEYHLSSVKPLAKPKVTYCQLDPKKLTFFFFFNQNTKFSFKKMCMKILSAKCEPCCSGLTVLNYIQVDKHFNSG